MGIRTQTRCLSRIQGVTRLAFTRVEALEWTAGLPDYERNGHSGWENGSKYVIIRGGMPCGNHACQQLNTCGMSIRLPDLTRTGSRRDFMSKSRSMCMPIDPTEL